MNILFSRTIGPVPIAVIIKESHKATLGITEQPIESGAKITDHAYREPKRLTLEFADGNAAETYNALVRHQETRQPFTFVSGLYVYDSMLIKSLEAERDDKTSRILKGSCELQEIIIVETAYAQSDDAGKNGKGDSKSNPNKSSNTSKSKAKGAETKDRASGTVGRGDTGSSSTVPPSKNQSVLDRLFTGKT